MLVRRDVSIHIERFERIAALAAESHKELERDGYMPPVRALMTRCKNQALKVAAELKCPSERSL